MKVPDAKAAADKEWEKLEKILAWQLTKVRNKREVIDAVRKEGNTVHRAWVMDICHLKSSERERPFQKKTKAEWHSEVIRALSQYLQSKVHLRHKLTAAKVMDQYRTDS